MVRYSPDFLRKLKSANVRVRKSFKQRVLNFYRNPNELELNNHALRNEWAGYRSINITDDWRAIFTEKTEGKEKVAYFVAIGTHKELYKR